MKPWIHENTLRASSERLEASSMSFLMTKMTTMDSNLDRSTYSPDVREGYRFIHGRKIEVLGLFREIGKGMNDNKGFMTSIHGCSAGASNVPPPAAAVARESPRAMRRGRA